MVDGVGEHLLVRPDVEHAHGEVTGAAGQDVLVQDDLAGVRGDLALGGGAGPGGGGTVTGDARAGQGGSGRGQDLGRREGPVGVGPPAVHRVLLAGPGPGPVPPATVERGAGDVGLGHPGTDLFEQAVLEAGDGGHHGVGIGVFGLQVRPDRGVVPIGQPLPVVPPGVAVSEVGGGAAGRDRGRGELGEGHSCINYCATRPGPHGHRRPSK